MRIQFILEIYVYRKNNKIKNADMTHPPSLPVTIFLIVEKLLRYDFSDFQFVFINFLLELVRKKTFFFKFYGF